MENYGLKIILLEAFPGVNWWGGIGVTIMLGIITWMTKTIIEGLREKLDKLEETVEDQEKDIQQIRQNINDQHISILKEINAVGIKIAEFQREISK